MVFLLTRCSEAFRGLHYIAFVTGVLGTFEMVCEERSFVGFLSKVPVWIFKILPASSQEWPFFFKSKSWQEVYSTDSYKLIIYKTTKLYFLEGQNCDRKVFSHVSCTVGIYLIYSRVSSMCYWNSILESKCCVTEVQSSAFSEYKIINEI